MTARATYWIAADNAARSLPDGWTAEKCEYGYRASHPGIAMNPMQWQKPGIWTIDTNEKKRSCRVSFHRNIGTRFRQAPILITGETLHVEKGPWDILRRPGETPLTAGVRWVQQQEDAARQYGSK